jgi:hypothetical protein
METECTAKQIEFKGLGKRKVVCDFSGGDVSSDAGGLLLREVDYSQKIVEQFASCFKDYRKPELIEHSVLELISQRVYGLCLGYEDLNDHDRLRTDPLLATLINKVDPSGKDRRRERDQGKACAGKSTLNRLELTLEEVSEGERYKKIQYDAEAIQRCFVDYFIQGKEKAPETIILDMDSTDDTIYGNQEGRFFHGYYGDYCYLPLYIFCGDVPLWMELRSSNIDGAQGAQEAITFIVDRIRQAWPEVHIIVRGDSGFCREELMAYCEANGIDYVFGLSKNERLLRKIEKALKKSRRRYAKTHQTSRRYIEFFYRTHKSWSKSRRVIGKAEYLFKGPNPRFIVTSLPVAVYRKQELYEKLYCARGDMENRIKEQQLGLFSDRTSTETMRANQLRVWFSGVAYVLMRTLREKALSNTQMATAQVWTIRERLFKIGAVIKMSFRRIWIQLSSHHPLQGLFIDAWEKLRRLPVLQL